MTLLTGIMELLSVNVLFILIIYNIVVDFLKLERLFGIEPKILILPTMDINLGVGAFCH
jgi:hypothetical protein